MESTSIIANTETKKRDIGGSLSITTMIVDYDELYQDQKGLELEQAKKDLEVPVIETEPEVRQDISKKISESLQPDIIEHVEYKKWERKRPSELI